MISFDSDYSFILDRIHQVDPGKYAKSRNYIDGSVSYLSPYLSRGVISTRQVMDHVFSLGLPFYKIEKFIQELAWRDYWQQVWIVKGNEINQDLKHKQSEVNNFGIPGSIVKGATGIIAIDQAIDDFYHHGYLHNHVRMYIASLACNIGKSHWEVPAQWMYYHLIDGDWASNALSWQWVAGANSNKKYLANQDNINRFCRTDQHSTFLDKAYEDLMEYIPENLKIIDTPELTTSLPDNSEIVLDPGLPVCIYNYYNMDPEWRKEEAANRILLLEPSVFDKYPVSKNSIHFLLSLRNNIPGIQVFTGEFNDLKMKLTNQTVYYKEHPLNKYDGVEDPRDWMFGVSGYFPSFFGFWKKCLKEIKG